MQATDTTTTVPVHVLPSNEFLLAFIATIEVIERSRPEVLVEYVGDIAELTLIAEGEHITKIEIDPAIEWFVPEPIRLNPIVASWVTAKMLSKEILIDVDITRGVILVCGNTAGWPLGGRSGARITEATPLYGLISAIQAYLFIDDGVTNNYPRVLSELAHVSGRTTFGALAPTVANFGKLIGSTGGLSYQRAAVIPDDSPGQQQG